MADRELYEKGVYTLAYMKQDEKYFYVEIRALKPGVNRNRWDFTLEGIKKHGKSFAGQPILIAYKGDKIGDGHNYDLTLNPITGEIEADFRGADAERIVGEIPEDADIRVETQNGEDWLILPARIWKYYAQQLVNYLVDNEVMDVSVEVEVADGYETRDDGVEVFTDWSGLGVTILGQGVTPAVEGARLRALAMSEEYKQMRVLAASYVPNNNSTGGSLMNDAMKKALSKAMAEHGTVCGFSADGRYASVLRKDGTPALYPCASFNEADGVIPSQFIGAVHTFTAHIDAAEGDGEDVNCEASEALATADAAAEAAKTECESAKAECEKAKADLAAANARVQELEKADLDRRRNEMKTAFDNAVSGHNLHADASEFISEEECNAVHGRIAEGQYDACADAIAEVVGEFKKLAYDKHAAKEKNERRTLAWNNIPGGESLTGEEAVIARFVEAGSK